MRRALFFLAFFPFLAFAQTTDSVSYYTPKWSLHFDVFNFQDNYPAFLAGVEYQFGEDFAIHQEFGPVLIPEAYGDNNFDRYFGFKGRTEMRLYYSQNPQAFTRWYLAVDIAYQVDQYITDYEIWRQAFTEIDNGKFVRTLWGSHFRVGNQRFFGSKKNVIVSGSIGFGRVFYNLRGPEDYDFLSGTDITDYPPLDPFSMNVRLKVGFVLGR
jgi:hypothetical protein